MNRKVYDYFENLENSDLPKDKNNILSLDPSILTRIASEDRSVLKFKKGDNSFYVKSWDNLKSIFGIASSNMYNDLGILNPPIYLIWGDDKDYPLIISENVRDLKKSGFICTIADKTPISQIAKNLPEYLKVNKWEILYNKDLRDIFLTFMTEDCFNDYITKLLADELRSDGDGHLGNFFLYKTIGKDGKVGKKFDGLIPIDLEVSDAVMTQGQYHKKSVKENFPYFLKGCRSSYSPIGKWHASTYLEDVDAIRELIAKGVLTPKTIKILKDELNYDLPKEIKRVGKKYGIKPSKEYEIISRLWDYHRKNIGKEL